MSGDLHTTQYAFAAHIRDPANNPAPTDIEDRRIKIYRDLFFSNINKFLSFNFPVLKSLYSPTGWSRLVREFYSEHFCHTPLFPELPREFLRYVQEQRGDRAGDPPFLLELAHYEWVELALSLDEHEIADVDADPHGDLLECSPVVSPLAWPLSYQFPVHQISPDFRPVEAPAEATHLLVYRNRADKVRFMQLNPVTQMLLNLLSENPLLTGKQHLMKLASLMRHPNPDALIKNGHQLLVDFLEKDIILGTKPTP